MKTKTVILIHGFKRQKKNDFAFFQLYAEKIYPEIEFISFDYYINNDKKTLSSKKYKKRIIEVFEAHKDQEDVMVIGYSIGAGSALSLTKNYENITRIVAIYPAIKVVIFDWIKKLYYNWKKTRKIKKKLGKEKYDKIKDRFHENKLVEKYPFTIVLSVNWFRFRTRKFLSELKNREIRIYLSEKDEIVNFGKSTKYINKNLNFKKNNIEIIYNEGNHFTDLEYENKDFFDSVLDFIK